MRIEKNRHITEMIILYDSEVPVTAEYLAYKTFSSVRTVRNDISWLTNELKLQGAIQIISHKARGYSIQIIDEYKSKELYYKLLVLDSLYTNRSVLDTNRWLYVVQTLLTYESIKKEILCEKLYISETTLSGTLLKVSEFLNSFHISVKSASNKGLYIDGKEQDLRSCIVEVACSSYHDTELLYPVIQFDTMIYEHAETYKEIRHALLKIIRESKIAVSDISSKKLATHICLIKKRVHGNKSLELSEELKDEICKTYEYDLAKEIFSDKTVSLYLGKQSDIEIINYARLLIINRDIDLRHTNDYDYMQACYIIENRRIFKKIREKMYNTLYRSFFKLEMIRVYEEDYESLLLQIYLKNRFDYANKERLVTYVEGDMRHISPFAKEITRIMLEYLEEEYHTSINGIEVQGIASLTDYIFKRVKYSYKKLRLATACMEGRTVANQIKESIVDHYRDYIEANDVFNLYEMRKIKFEDYDALIMQSNFRDNQKEYQYFSYPIKMIPYVGLDTTEKHTSEKLFESLFLSGYSREQLVHICNITNILSGINITSYNMLFEVLSYKYGKTDTDQKYLYEHLITRNGILSYTYETGVALINFDYDHTEKEFVDVYSVTHSSLRNNVFEIRYVIAVCINENLNISEIKQINRMLQMIVNDQKNIEELIDNPRLTWEKLWVEILKNSFVNGF